jgi:hypothetical protein
MLLDTWFVKCNIASRVAIIYMTYHAEKARNLRSARRRTGEPPPVSTANC